VFWVGGVVGDRPTEDGIVGERNPRCLSKFWTGNLRTAVSALREPLSACCPAVWLTLNFGRLMKDGNMEPTKDGFSEENDRSSTLISITRLTGRSEKRISQSARRDS
jgi:hypothetical protein